MKLLDYWEGQQKGIFLLSNCFYQAIPHNVNKFYLG